MKTPHPAAMHLTTQCVYWHHLTHWCDRRRFEAHTPAPQRIRGYYALPLLWHDKVIGWGNVSVTEGGLQAYLGYVAGKKPPDAVYRMALEAELEQLRAFLRLPATI